MLAVNLMILLTHYCSFAVLAMRMLSPGLPVFSDVHCTTLTGTNVLHVLEVVKN